MKKDSAPVPIGLQVFRCRKTGLLRFLLTGPAGTVRAVPGAEKDFSGLQGKAGMLPLTGRLPDAPGRVSKGQGPLVGGRRIETAAPFLVLLSGTKEELPAGHRSVPLPDIFQTPRM